MKRTTEFRAMPKANCTNTAHKKWGKINGNGKTFSLAPSCVTPSSLESPPVTWTTTFPLPQLPSLRFFFWCSATLSSIFFCWFWGQGCIPNAILLTALLGICCLAAWLALAGALFFVCEISFQFSSVWIFPLLFFSFSMAFFAWLFLSFFAVEFALESSREVAVVRALT